MLTAEFYIIQVYIIFNATLSSQYFHTYQHISLLCLEELSYHLYFHFTEFGNIVNYMPGLALQCSSLKYHASPMTSHVVWATGVTMYMLGRSKSHHKCASLRFRFITLHNFFCKLFNDTFSIETYVVLEGRMID
jgi:hypothetical protein